MRPLRSLIFRLATKPNKALFVDLDGTVRYVEGEERAPNQPYEVKAFPQAVERIQQAVRDGWFIVGITNQGGIDAGHTTEELCLQSIEYTWKQLGLPENTPCLYAKGGKGDPRRKPNPTMILEAVEKYNIDPRSSVFVGDQRTDMLAAQRANVLFIWADQWRKHGLPAK